MTVSGRSGSRWNSSRGDELHRGQGTAPKYDDLAAALRRAADTVWKWKRIKVANGSQISREMRDRLFSALSGGEQTRVNLARLILEDTDVLLFGRADKPSRYGGDEWLEEYLAAFMGRSLPFRTIDIFRPVHEARHRD
jgi:ATPase subunit of ABC transporter with duplicated ATPase domains